MQRRDFLARLAAGAILPALAAAAHAQTAPAARRPNFLFIYTDDQRWDALGCVQRELGANARFPWLRTPNLDRLAAEGVRFRQAFVVNSLCAPSRACFLTGRYSHLNGVANNHTSFPLDSVTHATELRKAGYRTGYFGKWHMGNQAERPGFDVTASYTGQGVYTDCPFLVDGVKTPTRGYADDVSTDYAIDFIRQSKDRPFSLVVGLKAVHDPRQPTEPHKDAYADATIRPSANAAAQAPYMRAAANDTKPAPKRNPTTPRQLDYFRCINGIDDNVGRMLAALDELKLAEDTVVIFASDNGYYLGDHGLGDKRTAYDESLRIPLLVRWPRVVKPGRLCDEMVLNIDLPSTLLDLAGAPVPPQMQGRSWRPLLEGGAPADWRKAFFYEYFLEAQYPWIPTTLAVRAEDAKLIRYPGHDEWTELYDLKADPLEMKNLWADPAAAALRERMTAEFERQARAVEFRIPDYADKPGDAPARKPGAKAKGKKPAPAKAAKKPAA